jgi:hypothetical protein
MGWDVRVYGTIAVPAKSMKMFREQIASWKPTPRLHTARYAGVLAPASKLRARIVPKLGPRRFPLPIVFAVVDIQRDG